MLNKMLCIRPNFSMLNFVLKNKKEEKRPGGRFSYDGFN